MIKWFEVESHRAYVYRIALAVIALLVGLGVLTEETAPFVIGLVAALLPVGLAVGNTTTK